MDLNKIEDSVDNELLPFVEELLDKLGKDIGITGELNDRYSLTYLWGSVVRLASKNSDNMGLFCELLQELASVFKAKKEGKTWEEQIKLDLGL